MSQIPYIDLSESSCVESRGENPVAVVQPDDPGILNALMTGAGINDASGVAGVYDSHLLIFARRRQEHAVLFPA